MGPPKVQLFGRRHIHKVGNGLVNERSNIFLAKCGSSAVELTTPKDFEGLQCWNHMTVISESVLDHLQYFRNMVPILLEKKSSRQLMLNPG
jgi:hypothetical protein